MEWAIHQGHWQALPRLDAKADVPAIQLMGFKTTWREIRELYNYVYQLKWLLGPPPCSPEQAEELAWEIVTSLKEHLRQRWGLALLGGGPEHSPTRTHMPDHPAKAPQRTWQKEDDSCDCALAEVREADQWALVAAHLLEEKNERLSQSVTRMQPTNCQCSYSHSHSRRQPPGCQRRSANTLAGRHHWKVLRGRQGQSPNPSPTRPRRHVTFLDQEST